VHDDLPEPPCSRAIDRPFGPNRNFRLAPNRGSGVLPDLRVGLFQGPEGVGKCCSAGVPTRVWAGP